MIDRIFVSGKKTYFINVIEQFFSSLRCLRQNSNGLERLIDKFIIKNLN
jgi:hypothetical protein